MVDLLSGSKPFLKSRHHSPTFAIHQLSLTNYHQSRTIIIHQLSPFTDYRLSSFTNYQSPIINHQLSITNYQHSPTIIIHQLSIINYHHSSTIIIHSFTNYQSPFTNYHSPSIIIHQLWGSQLPIFSNFSRCRFWKLMGGSEKNWHKSEKIKNNPMIPAVVCSYTYKCSLYISLMYYQYKISKKNLFTSDALTNEL